MNVFPSSAGFGRGWGLQRDRYFPAKKFIKEILFSIGEVVGLPKFFRVPVAAFTSRKDSVSACFNRCKASSNASESAAHATYV